MPTDQRIHSAIIDITEGLSDIGYNVTDLIGPINNDGEEIPEEEVNTEESDVVYYLTAETSHANFYIRFTSSDQYAVVVYPMNVLRHLGSYLNKDELAELLDRSIDWDVINDGDRNMLFEDAAKKIVDNTDPVKYHTAAFNLSAYASTSLVNYRQITTENGFPTEFQCARALFPYTEHMTIRRIDDRVQPTIISGERGRRYMEYSFHIDKEDRSPKEYEFKAII